VWLRAAHTGDMHSRDVERLIPVYPWHSLSL
jgi:hypothetical protein